MRLILLLAAADLIRGHAINRMVFGMFGSEIDTRKLLRNEILAGLQRAGIVPYDDDPPKQTSKKRQLLSKIRSSVGRYFATHSSYATCAIIDTTILTPIVAVAMESVGLPETSKLLTPYIVAIIIAGARNAQHAGTVLGRRELRRNAAQKLAEHLFVPPVIAKGFVVVMEDVLRQMARVCLGHSRRKQPIKPLSLNKRLQRIYSSTPFAEASNENHLRIHRVLSETLDYVKEDPILEERMSNLLEPLVSYCGALQGEELADCTLRCIDEILGRDMASMVEPLVDYIAFNEEFDKDLIRLVSETNEDLAQNERLRYDEDAA